MYAKPSTLFQVLDAQQCLFAKRGGPPIRANLAYNPMAEFDDAVLGRIASDLNAALRDGKRQIRDHVRARPTVPYGPQQSSAAQDVIAALALVDRAFSGCRLSDPLRHCDCCKDPALIARLQATPRDAISEDDMAAVAGSLLYTLGEVADLAYFVPRFCSDSIVSPLYDVDAVFARIRRAGFDEWPDAQKDSVRRFLLAHWRFALLFEPRRGLSAMTDPWLVTLDCIASVYDIEYALNVWETTNTESADARLLELLDCLQVWDDSVRIAGVGDYGENAGPYAKLSRWLRSPAMEARINAALESLRATDSDTAARIDSVLGDLRRLP